VTSRKSTAPAVTGAVDADDTFAAGSRMTNPRSGGRRVQRCVIALGALCWMAAASDGLAAGDPKAGRAKALLCQACHGTDGLSVVPDAPNIAGQTENYLLTQLAAFKSGARKSEAMNVVASTLSDQDVANLAAYFSAIEIKVVKVPGE
jgi:cytochrome c553